MYDCSINGNIIHLDCDVANLSDGLHSITIVPFDRKNGIVLEGKTAFFMKIPKGGEGISSYRYWINDDIDNMVNVNLDNPSTELSIVSLLDVKSYPIKSSSYHFDVASGTPCYYGVNAFNMNVFDNSGRISSFSRDYVDTQSAVKITDLPILQQGNENRVESMATNEIKWFKLTAETGDSLVLKTDTPCSFELYSPSGAKVYAATGFDSLIAGGIHAKENGVYYLAVHDAARNTPINISYALIDKYAVLSYTPNKSVYSDFIRMKLVGNGFEHLKHITLSDGDLFFHCDNLEIEDYNHAKCSFNFTTLSNKIEKDFDLLLTFNDEGEESTLEIKNGFSLTLGIKGDITVEVLPSYVPATPYTTTIRITNTGDVPYWGIPFNMAIPITKEGYTLSFLNFIPYQDVESTPYPIVTNNLLNSKTPGCFFPMLLPYIGPNEVIDLKIGITGPPHGIVRIYAWTGEPWSEEFERLCVPGHSFDEYFKPQSNIFSATTLCKTLAEKDPRFTSIFKSRNKASAFDGIDDIDNHRPTPSDLAEHNSNIAKATGMAIAGIANGCDVAVNDAVIANAGITLGDDPTYDFLGEMQNRKKNMMPSPLHALLVGLGILDVDDGDLFKGEPERNAESNNPAPTPYDIANLAYGDPNDIYGYRSESGSEYIGLHVKSVPYTIEFENSPELANTLVPKIVVKDNFNPKIFDLKSIKTESVSFGDKKVIPANAHNFVETVDMRPDINSIAQVSFKIDEQTGDATWEIESLDPLTLAPTTHYMQGVLPVNNNGEGQGFINLNINLNPSIKDNTYISNSASIVFGTNGAIETPKWENITDFSRPQSCVTEISQINDSEIDIKISSSDVGSGIWFTQLFYKEGDDGHWTLLETIYEGDNFRFNVAPGVKYSFCSLSTDQAGNEEEKEFKPEYTYQDGNIMSATDKISIDNVSDDECGYDILGRKLSPDSQSKVIIYKNKKIIK